MGSCAEEARSALDFLEFSGSLAEGGALERCGLSLEEARRLARAEHERVTGRRFVPPPPADRWRAQKTKRRMHRDDRGLSPQNLTGVNWDDPAMRRRFFQARRAVLRSVGVHPDAMAAEVAKVIPMRELRLRVAERLRQEGPSS